MPATDRLLTTAEACDVLSVHEDTLRDWLRNGEIEGCKVGTGWRIPASEIFHEDGTPKRQIGPKRDAPHE